MKSLTERIQRFAQLPPGERAILAQAWALFLIAELALRFLPLTRLLRLTDGPLLHGRHEPARRSLPPLPRLAWLVKVAGRYAPVKATCLKEAMVFAWLLRKRGICTALRIGVARQGAGIEAHAWVEGEGQVLFGHPEGQRYEPLWQAGGRGQS